MLPILDDTFFHYTHPTHFDLSNIITTSRASNTIEIFKKFGLSNSSAVLLIQQMYSEYLEHLPAQHFKESFKLVRNRPNFKFFSATRSEYQRYDDAFENLNILSKKKSRCPCHSSKYLLSFTAIHYANLFY